jgi:hypothetical protein
VAIDEKERKTTAPANPLTSPKQKKRIEKTESDSERTEQGDQNTFDLRI